MGKKEKGVRYKLKPCKYCRDKSPKFRYDEPTMDFLRFDFVFRQKCCVSCDECGYSTQKHKHEYKALLEWNNEVKHYE